jgi:hypothetical protein
MVKRMSTPYKIARAKGKNIKYHLTATPKHLYYKDEEKSKKESLLLNECPQCKKAFKTK